MSWEEHCTVGEPPKSSEEEQLKLVSSEANPSGWVRNLLGVGLDSECTYSFCKHWLTTYVCEYRFVLEGGKRTEIAFTSVDVVNTVHLS